MEKQSKLISTWLLMIALVIVFGLLISCSNKDTAGESFIAAKSGQIQPVVSCQVVYVEANTLPDDGHECSDVEWHFVIKGGCNALEGGQCGLPVQSIVVFWHCNDGNYEEVVPLQRCASDVAHYNTSHHLETGCSVTNATAELPEEWGQYPNQKFLLSHGLCPTSTTTTSTTSTTNPSAVDLVSFEVKPQMINNQHSNFLSWETASELDNLGFFVKRCTSINGNYINVSGFIPSKAPGQGQGAMYEFQDLNIPNITQRYYYKLEDIDMNGTRTPHGPIGYQWVFGSRGLSCNQACGGVGYCINSSWNDDANCSIINSKSPNTCTRCQVGGDYYAPYQHYANNCYRLSPGATVSCSTSNSVYRRLCACKNK